MKINKAENILGISLVTIMISLIVFSIGYTIFTNGIFSIGSQNRYFDYQEYP